MFNLGSLMEKFIPNLRAWVSLHYFNLAIFNLILIILVLLRSAGYFQPYLPITIHTIIFITILLLIFLLGVNSKFLSLLTVLLWVFAAFLKMVGVDVWAERTTIYAYEALVVSILLLISENLKKR